MRSFMIAALAVFFAVPAIAAGGCLPRDAILKKLDETDHYIVFVGPNGDGTYFEAFATHAGKWVIMRTMLDGQTCPIVWGGDFEAFPLPPRGEPV